MDKEKIYKKLVHDMSIHSQVEYPREACGIVTTDFHYISCKNISFHPKISFVLDPIALWDHEDTTWGIFHSHPGDENPLPSEEDVASTVFDCYKFLVGFAGKIFIYWYDKELEYLRYEPFELKHLTDDNY